MESSFSSEVEWGLLCIEASGHAGASSIPVLAHSPPIPSTPSTLSKPHKSHKPPRPHTTQPEKPVPDEDGFVEVCHRKNKPVKTRDAPLLGEAFGIRKPGMKQRTCRTVKTCTKWEKGCCDKAVDGGTHIVSLKDGTLLSVIHAHQ